MYTLLVKEKLDWHQHLKSLVVTIIWHSLIVSQWRPWLMTSVGHDIVAMSTFHSLIRYRGHHDGRRMWSRKCLPFRSTWFYPWFSWRFMLSCHLCLLISCDSLVFWILSFDCSFCLIVCCLYILLKAPLYSTSSLYML